MIYSNIRLKEKWSNYRLNVCDDGDASEYVYGAAFWKAYQWYFVDGHWSSEGDGDDGCVDGDDGDSVFWNTNQHHYDIEQHRNSNSCKYLENV